MALNLSTLTSPTTSSDIIADIENPAASGDLVVTLKNLATESGATTNATQTVSAAQGTAVQGDTSYLVMDLVDDEYEFTTDSAVNGTIVVATLEGTYSANISLSASTQYDLQARGVSSIANRGFLKNVIGYLITPTQLSDSEITNIEAYFVDKGAAARSAFGSRTNFTSAWSYCNSLTSFPAIDTSSGTSFFQTWRECSSLTPFPAIDTSSGTRFDYAWFRCRSLTSFPAIDTSSGTKFNQAWRDCNSLTSFPQLDTSSGTNFEFAWQNCNSLTSFPALDTSSGTSFVGAWRGCSSLTSFPQLNTLSGTNFSSAWQDCSSLTSFPALDTSSGTSFVGAWYNCTSLTSFPANFFDSWSPASVSNGVFNVTWDGCSSLTAQSVENILTSIDTSSIYGTDTGLSSGTQLADHTIDIDYDNTNTLTVSTNSAIRSLNNKDWKVNVNDVIRSGGGEMDLQGLYFFDAKSLSTGNVTTWDSLISTSSASLNLTGTQAGSNDQPVADGTKVNFADNSDHLTIPSTTQAGWQVAGTSLGTFAYKVNNNAVTELNLLGNLGNTAYRKTGNLYGVILLPDDSTDDDIEDARNLLIDRGAADGATATDISNYFRNRSDIVEFGNVDTSNVTRFSNAWSNCSSLTSFPLIDTSSATNFSGTWQNCSSLTSFPLVNTSLITVFYYTWTGCSSLTSFPLIDTSSVTNFRSAWHNCSSLTSFPQLDTSSGTNFTNAWQGCSSLTSFPLINTSLVENFYYAWYNCNSLTSFPLIDTSSGTSFGNTWYNCSSLTSFPLINTSSVTSFYQTWRNCSSLTSFPAINTSSGTSFVGAWWGCSSLTSFPAINTSSGTDFTNTWRSCSSLTSFPQLDTSSGTNFNSAWYNCNSLTSFPDIDTSSGTDFYRAWRDCSSLTSFGLINPESALRFRETWMGCSDLATFPANFFDDWSPPSLYSKTFDNAWDGCTSLTAQSVENILTSIDTSGIYGTDTGLSSGTQLADAGIDIDYDGTTLSNAANSAIDSLIGKGWEVYINGELVIPNILDLQPAAAYSLRSFDADADPNVVNVRRSSDGAVSDFTASEVSDGTLVAFVGAGNDGYVTTWYDQGGTNHATQSTASQQPKIVDAGTLVTENGLAALDFDGTNDELIPTANFSSTTDPRTYLAVFTSSDTDGLIVGGNNQSFYDTYGNALYINNSEIKGKALSNSNGVLLESAITANATYLATLRLLDGDSSLYVNGTEEATSSNNLFTHSYTTQIGGGQYTNDNLDGTIQEIVVFDTDQSANRTAIENNINDHFDIYS